MKSSPDETQKQHGTDSTQSTDNIKRMVCEFAARLDARGQLDVLDGELREWYEGQQKTAIQQALGKLTLTEQRLLGLR